MNYLIKLTEQDLKVLSAALSEMPYKVAAPLVAKIGKQLDEQSSHHAPGVIDDELSDTSAKGI